MGVRSGLNDLSWSLSKLFLNTYLNFAIGSRHHEVQDVERAYCFGKEYFDMKKKYTYIV